MDCEICGMNPATIAYTHVVEDGKKTVHICSFCASKEKGGAATKTPITTAAKKVKTVLGTIDPPPVETSYCKACGLAYEEFRKAGRFGCSTCYISFAGLFERILERIHGSVRHCGKVFPAVREAVPLEEQLDRLAVELQAAAANEEFEKAAELRDHIAELRRDLEESD